MADCNPYGTQDNSLHAHCMGAQSPILMLYKIIPIGNVIQALQKHLCKGNTVTPILIAVYYISIIPLVFKKSKNKYKDLRLPT